MHQKKQSRIVQYLTIKKQSLAQTLPGLSTTSRISYGSSKTSKNISYRIHQIKPTMPILCLKKQNENKTAKNISLQSTLSDNGKIDITHETSEINSMHYHQIKPMVSLDKYLICSAQQQSRSRNGCQCTKKPCKWKKSWSRNYKTTDGEIYHRLLAENKPKTEDLEQIDKDYRRTYPQCPTFHSNQLFLEQLRELLHVYAIYDPQVGYVQGMNMIMAVLLFHIKEVERTFWAFVELMEQQELRPIYLQNFTDLHTHAHQIEQHIRNKIADLYSHMQTLGVSCQLFLYGWLLSLMTKNIPLEFMHLVIDKFRGSGWKFIYRLIITLFLYLKEPLLLCEDGSEFLIQLNRENLEQIGIDWVEMISNCYRVEL